MIEYNRKSTGAAVRRPLPAAIAAAILALPLAGLAFADAALAQGPATAEPARSAAKAATDSAAAVPAQAATASQTGEEDEEDEAKDGVLEFSDQPWQYAFDRLVETRGRGEGTGSLLYFIPWGEGTGSLLYFIPCED